MRFWEFLSLEKHKVSVGHVMGREYFAAQPPHQAPNWAAKALGRLTYIWTMCAPRGSVN